MSEIKQIRLRGGTIKGCECMAATLPLIEDEMLRLGLIKKCLDVSQGAYNPGKVKKSAGTHDKGGVIDVGQYSLAQRKVWAKYGVMMFPRTSMLGWLTGNHGHGVWHGCPHQVPYTDWQVRSGIAGGDGLGSSASLRGRKWRHFEAPTMTWQQAVKKYGTTHVVPKRAATSETDPNWSDMATKAEIEAIVTNAINTAITKKFQPIIRAEFDRPSAGFWKAKWGDRNAMNMIKYIVETSVAKELAADRAKRGVK